MKYKKTKETPLMRQYNSIKANHPGTIILFRVGDFYETFGEDAIITSKALNIVLTKRSNGAAASVDLAGFPHHALDTYLPKLLQEGHRVAICDQLEDPKYAKGIVKRGITDIATPALTYNENVLSQKTNNYLGALYSKKKLWGISLLDLSSGEFLTSEGDIKHIKKILESYDPKEVLYFKKSKKEILSLLRPKLPAVGLEDWIFEYDYAYEKITNYFQIKNLKSFGIQDLKYAIIASGAILRYMEQSKIIPDDTPESVQNINKQDIRSSSKGLRERTNDISFLESKITNSNNIITIDSSSSVSPKQTEAASAAVIDIEKPILKTNFKKQRFTPHINSIKRINLDEFVWLDSFTIKNLELIKPQQPEGIALIDIIDKTITSTASRLLRKWLLFPLKDKVAIEKRLNIVQVFYENEKISQIIGTKLRNIYDLERLAAKLGALKINPKEIVALKNSLSELQEIKKCSNLIISSKNNDSVCQDFKYLLDKIHLMQDAISQITGIIDENSALSLNEEGFIKSGVNEELDGYRRISDKSEAFLENLKKTEIQKTGISSLKISFNKIFGYYIEVTHAHKNKVPREWIRKQTLVNAERYITEDLKVHEEKILQAKEQISSLELIVYKQLLENLICYIKDIQRNARIIAEIDCYLSFANLAKQNDYVRPVLYDHSKLEINGTKTTNKIDVKKTPKDKNEILTIFESIDKDSESTIFDKNSVINIKKGRHPVIEQTLDIDQTYIPNDIVLNKDLQQIIIVTGPNMSGKSALLRQVALITILAQIGSYVPAESADIEIVDKVFTRVGASDNIAKGESTFMVEMNETANILNNLTPQSLVIMDEIGRGTSTFDGISIAYAIVEYLHDHKFRPKTLFATHYHELNDLASHKNRIKNYNVEIKEQDDKVIFMYKLKQGGSKHSYGINVAKLAGIPIKVIDRAKYIMDNFVKKNKFIDKDLSSLNDCIKSNNNESSENWMKENGYTKINKEDYEKFTKIKAILQKINVNGITPIESLMKLNEVCHYLK